MGDQEIKKHIPGRIAKNWRAEPFITAHSEPLRGPRKMRNIFSTWLNGSLLFQVRDCFGNRASNLVSQIARHLAQTEDVGRLNPQTTAHSICPFPV
jgi:hypothetical protein